jgi:hypothetical protein
MRDSRIGGALVAAFVEEMCRRTKAATKVSTKVVPNLVVVRTRCTVGNGTYESVIDDRAADWYEQSYCQHETLTVFGRRPASSSEFNHS